MKLVSNYQGNQLYQLKNSIKYLSPLNYELLLDEIENDSRVEGKVVKALRKELSYLANN